MNIQLCNRGIFTTPSSDEAEKYCRFPPRFVSKFKAVRKFDVIVVTPELLGYLQNDNDVQNITLDGDGLVNVPLSKVLEFHANSVFKVKIPNSFEDAGLERALRLKYPSINGYKRNSYSSTIGTMVEEFCLWNNIDLPPIVETNRVAHIKN